MSTLTLQTTEECYHCEKTPCECPVDWDDEYYLCERCDHVMYECECELICEDHNTTLYSDDSS